MSSAVRCWSRSDDESEEVGGRGGLFSSSSQPVFLSFSQIYFPSAEGKKKKKEAVAVATTRMFTEKEVVGILGTENRLNTTFWWQRKEKKYHFMIHFMTLPVKTSHVGC